VHRQPDAIRQRGKHNHIFVSKNVRLVRLNIQHAHHVSANLQRDGQLSFRLRQRFEVPVTRLFAYVVCQQGLPALRDVTNDVVPRTYLRACRQFKGRLVRFFTARAGAEKDGVRFAFQRKNSHIVIVEGAQDSLADFAGQFVQTRDVGYAGYNRCNQRQARFLALLAVFRA